MQDKPVKKGYYGVPLRRSAEAAGQGADAQPRTAPQVPGARPHPPEPDLGTPSLTPLSMGDYGHQGDFGEQFVQSLAISANLDVVPRPWRDRRGVDWEFTYPSSDGARKHPRILAQVKCWARSQAEPEDGADAWRYPLRIHNYNLLAGRDWYDPRFLFLVVVPDDQSEWVDVSPEGLLLRYAAYWACFHDDTPLEGRPKDSKFKVPVPKANLLTIPALHSLFGREFRAKLGES